TAIYTVVDRVLLRPLPYPHPDRLAIVMREHRGIGISEDEVGQAGVTWDALTHGATAKLEFAALAGGFSDGVNLAAGGRPEYVRQQRVSAGYFHLLAVAPEIGREFPPGEGRPDGPSGGVPRPGRWAGAFQAG